MGHAHHFLSRLDRVSLPHLELALALYRDQELLQYVLGRVRLPDSAQRVAISLQDPQKGPFLVVSTTGQFVTCLAEGMVPYNLPIIERSHLEALTAHVETLRARVAAAQQHKGSQGHVGRLLQRLYYAGPDLSREDFCAISAWQPILAPEFLRLMLGLNTDLLAARDILRRLRRPQPRQTDALRAFWNGLFGLGHLSVLTFLGGKQALGSLPLDAENLPISPSWGLVRQGLISLALRAAWSTGKAGKALLPVYKRGLAQAQTPLSMLDSCLGLAVLALRHAKLRTEILGALGAAVHRPASSPLEQKAVQLLSALLPTIRLGLERPEQALGAQLHFGRSFAVALGKSLPEGSPYRFTDPAHVPEPLAYTLTVNHPGDIANEAMSVLHIFLCLPWVARVGAEDLYLPEDFVRAVRRPFDPQEALSLIHRLARHSGKPTPQRAPARPEPNAPCPCASGRKYKRCCGRTHSSSGSASVPPHDS